MAQGFTAFQFLHSLGDPYTVTIFNVEQLSLMVVYRVQLTERTRGLNHLHVAFLTGEMAS